MARVAIKIYFSDVFDVDKKVLNDYGAFNLSLVADLPLFIDPFLLFNSKKKEYQELHEEIIKYLRFLRDKSILGNVSPGLIGAWYRFPEIKQNHFGFCLSGNDGRGLGYGFAQALNENLYNLFSDFGHEQNKISKGHHLEKLCLIRAKVGKDSISDFTTNLIKGFLLTYTEIFAKKYVHSSLRKKIQVDHVRFNFKTGSWERDIFDLPFDGEDYVLLTPKDILTKDDIWINKHDLIGDFDQICNSIPNEQLAAQVGSYFQSVLPRRPKVKDRDEAARKTILKFRQLIDYYIKYKEENGDLALDISRSKVDSSHHLYVDQFSRLATALHAKTGFYGISGSTQEEALLRIQFLKDVIENKDGYRIFYEGEKPIKRESDLQILFRLTWCGTVSDLNREVNNGRGPADFTVSRGVWDKGLVEMKLASNTGLKRNLLHQAEIYKKASEAQYAYKVILYFSREERMRVESILDELELKKSPWIILIDARSDNKPSASKADSH
jgi:hypothetical protein